MSTYINKTLFTKVQRQGVKPFLCYMQSQLEAYVTLVASNLMGCHHILIYKSGARCRYSFTELKLSDYLGGFYLILSIVY